MKGNTKKRGSAWNWAKAAAPGLGILALVFGLALAGCDDPNNDSKKTTEPPAGGWWTKVSNSIFTDDDIYSVAYNGTDKWVAVGSSGKIATSPDGKTWTAANTTSSGFGTEYSSIIYGVAYGGAAGAKRWVAVGSNEHFGRIAYSADGTNWTGIEQTFSFDIYGVAYGGAEGAEKWVAVGNRISYYSEDGISWTEVSTNAGVNCVAYDGAEGEEKWVAVGGGIKYSMNGTSWTVARPSGSLNSVAYGNGKWVAVGSKSSGGREIGFSMTSANGTSWIETESFPFANEVNGVAYGGTGANAKFVAVCDKTATSTDGVTWTEETDSVFSDNPIQSVAYGGGKWVAVGYGGTIAYHED